MGSKERILRLKDETREKILEAALSIGKMDGWQALSMRKIADQIEYTAPFIYEYFLNKEGILLELARKGYLILTQDIREACHKHERAEDKIEAMWIAYWNFAFKHKEFYRLMFGVDMLCCKDRYSMPQVEDIYLILRDVIISIFNKRPFSEEIIRVKYYTYWSLIHGLISINLVHLQGRISDEVNTQILRDAIQGITSSINT